MSLTELNFVPFHDNSSNFSYKMSESLFIHQRKRDQKEISIQKRNDITKSHCMLIHRESQDYTNFESEIHFKTFFFHLKNQVKYSCLFLFFT